MAVLAVRGIAAHANTDIVRAAAIASALCEGIA